MKLHRFEGRFENLAKSQQDYLQEACAKRGQPLFKPQDKVHFHLPAGEGSLGNAMYEPTVLPSGTNVVDMNGNKVPERDPDEPRKAPMFQKTYRP